LKTPEQQAGLDTGFLAEGRRLDLTAEPDEGLVALVHGQPYMSGVTYTQEDWEAPWDSDAQPNQRLQLTLLPIGDRPLAVLRGGLVDYGERVLTSLVRMTPAFVRGAAETHNR